MLGLLQLLIEDLSTNTFLMAGCALEFFIDPLSRQAGLFVAGERAAVGSGDGVLETAGA